MIRALTTMGLLLLLVFSAMPAHADDAVPAFGDKGQIILSADRLMGFFDYTSTKVKDPTGQQSDSINYASFSLLQNPLGAAYAANPGSASGVAVIAPYNAPRLSFDYTVIPHVTVGGSFVVFFTPGANETEKSCASGMGCVTASSGTTSATLFGFAPRGGYILGINRLLSIWPRGGVSIYSLHLSTPLNGGTGTGPSGNTSSTYTQFMVNLEPMVVLTPATHVGITAGPVVDIPVVGGVKTTTTTGGVSSTPPGDGLTLFHIGVEVGLLAWF
jgi:hypothetical protein